MTEVDTETLSHNWWSFLFSCCNSCHTRNKSTMGSKAKPPKLRTMRVIVVGSPRAGKSRALALLSGSPVKDIYNPTGGTQTSRIRIGDTAVSLVEVGGGLRPFWSRAVDSRTNAIWYMLTADEVSSKDFATLREFLNEVSARVSDQNLCVLVSIFGTLGVSQETANSSISETFKSCGIYESPIISTISDVSYPSLVSSLEDVLTKLASRLSMSDSLLLAAAKGDDKFDWADLRTVILSRLGSAAQPPNGASPASTVALPKTRIESTDEMREYLIDCIAGMRSAPVATQRLCELLLTSQDDTAQFHFALERIVSASRTVVRTRRADASPASSSVYSVSPGRRRHLIRPRFSL